MKNGMPRWVLLIMLALLASATALAAGPNSVGNLPVLTAANSANTSSAFNSNLNDGATILALDRLAPSLVGSHRYSSEFRNGSDAGPFFSTQQSAAPSGFLRLQIGDRSYIESLYFNQQGGWGVDAASVASAGRGAFSKSVVNTAPVAGEFSLGSVILGSELDHLTLFLSLSKTDRGLSSQVGSDSGAAMMMTAAFPNSIHPSAAQFSELRLKNERFEAKLSSNSERAIQWLVGIYHKDTEIDADYSLFKGPQYVGAKGVDRDQHQYGERAVFGEGSVELPGNVNLSVGLRYLDYDFSRRTGRGALPEELAPLAQGSGASIDSSSSDEASNYRVTLSWDYSDGSQAYISMSDAARPIDHHRSTLDTSEGQVLVCDQGVSAPAVDRGGPVVGDSIEHLELGLKAEPANGLRVNAALYRIEWTDIRQRLDSVGSCGLNLSGSFSEAVSMGLELGLTATMTEYLTINAGLGYSDGQLSESQDFGDPEQTSEVPELSWSLSADWSQPIGDGELFVFGSVSYVDDAPILAGLNGDSTLSLSNDGSVLKTEQTLVDVRLGYSSSNRWRAAVFIDNLTDEKTVYSGDGAVFNLPGYDRGTRNRPRTVGVSASYSF